MAERITRKTLEALVASVSTMGGWPAGPYPTRGQLILNQENGRYRLCCLVKGTGEADVSRSLTTSEMDEFLRGMIAAYDGPRFMAHWGITPAEVAA